MALPESTSLTEEAYLALDNESDIRHEYISGEVYAMSGASREHNIIALNTSTSLNQQLRERECEVYQSDMRVQIKSAASYRYPDIVVVCGTPEFTETTPESLLNPTVLIEVLSESTAVTDRIDKFREYRLIQSLQEYVLISQDTPRVERYFRQDDLNWLYTEVSGINREIKLPSIDCTLHLSELFRRISFENASKNN